MGVWTNHSAAWDSGDWDKYDWDYEKNDWAWNAWCVGDDAPDPEGQPEERVEEGANLFSDPNYWGEAVGDSPRGGLEYEVGTENEPVGLVW